MRDDLNTSENTPDEVGQNRLLPILLVIGACTVTLGVVFVFAFWFLTAGPTEDDSVILVKGTSHSTLLATKWTFRYPGRDGQPDTQDDIESLDQLFLPENKRVSLVLESKGHNHQMVIYFPGMKVSCHAIAGVPTQMDFTPPEIGEFKMIRGGGSGTSRPFNKTRVIVQSLEDFEDTMKQLEISKHDGDLKDN